ncbi:MAG: hypothetical protein LAP85_27555 [Acidobacteriia bacterium]|nr:hypothetical protein [Terriglobia bacterium]
MKIKFHRVISTLEQGPAPRWVVVGAGSLVGAYFIYFTTHVFQSWLLWDDFFNTHYYWSRPVSALIKGNLIFFSDYYRPLGGIFFLGLYKVFGINAMATHLAVLAILLIDLFILYGIAFALSDAREIGFFCALLGAYHFHLRDLYFQGGMVYDSLAFLFFFSCLWWYVRIRKSGQTASWTQIGGLLALFICALNAKEISVCLPLLIISYELLYHPLRRWTPRAILTWSVTEGRFALVAGISAVMYAVGKSIGPEALSNNPVFRPHLSLATYLGNYGSHITGLFYGAFQVRAVGAGVILGGMLLVAIVVRSRMLAFSALLAILGFLPVGFIELRNGYAIYVPFGGWVMYVATLTVRLRDLVVQALSVLVAKLHVTVWPGLRVIKPVPILICFAWFVVPQNYRGIEMIGEGLRADEYGLHTSYQQLSQIGHKLRPGANVLLIRDSSPVSAPAITFLIRLFYGDKRLQAVRAKEFCARRESVPLRQYDLVLDYEQGRYIDLTSHWTAADMAGICKQPDEYIDQQGKVVRLMRR